MTTALPRGLNEVYISLSYWPHHWVARFTHSKVWFFVSSMVTIVWSYCELNSPIVHEPLTDWRNNNASLFALSDSATVLPMLPHWEWFKNMLVWLDMLCSPLHKSTEHVHEPHKGRLPLKFRQNLQNNHNGEDSTEYPSRMATKLLLVSILTGYSRVYGQPQAPIYSLIRNYTGQTFFDAFNFYSKADPSNSFVRYVDLHTANDSALAGLVDHQYTDDHNQTQHEDKLVYLGVDFESQIDASSGRPSVRMECEETFNQALYVADIFHMPGGCGVWPAFWLLGTGLEWPKAGEIDVLEGINDQSLNMMSLHTDKHLSLDNNTWTNSSTAPSEQLQTGNTLSTECDVASSGGTGCSIVGSNSTHQGFGTTFNSNQGGYLITEFTSKLIKIWQIARSSGNMAFANQTQPDVSIGDMRSWGPPSAVFSRNGTDLSTYFQNLQMIFNTAFCGPWIDGTWNSSSCASLAPTCKDYVSSNPSAFVDAYWLVKGVYVYESNSTGH